MRQNVCIILNSKSRKHIYKEMHRVVDLYREDKHMTEEYELKYHPKDVLEKEYEEFKDKYRHMSPSTIENGLKRTGCKDIEEFIEYAVKQLGMDTLEKYAYKLHGIVRFDGNKSIGLRNPKGYIDSFCGVLACGKYRKFTRKDIDNLDISEVILPNNAEVSWDIKKEYKVNKLRIRQAIRKYADKNTYIVVVRVRY